MPTDDKPAAEPAAAPEALPPAEAPLDADLDEPAVQPVSAASGERAEIEKRIRALALEREDTTNLLPWLTVILGAATVLAGTVTGVASAFECKPDEAGCESPPWAEFAVVLGIAIGSAGAVWLVRTDRGIAELELKRTKLQYDLDRLEAGRARRSGLARAPASQLRLKLEF
jgi:hypothetical protein